MGRRIGKKLEKTKEQWKGLKSSSRFHNAMLYLSFVAVATLFWFILALNDNVTETVDVRLRIANVPDTVTFINDPPKEFHVTLRDKGTNLLRNGIVSHPQVDLNFRDFANNGVFRFSKSDMNSALKARFGTSAQITSTSIDSLYLRYTTGKGRRMPVVVRSDVSAANGYILSGPVEPLTRAVMVYSYPEVLDTMSRVYTEVLSRRNLSETSVYVVKLCNIPNAKIEPNQIEVRIPVEPMVKKESMVTIHAKNVPAGESLLLFPSRVLVSYFVPMSLFNSDLIPIDIAVDYNDTKTTRGDRIPVRIYDYADYIANVELRADSVEYTLVKE